MLLYNAIPTPPKSLFRCHKYVNILSNNLSIKNDRSRLKKMLHAKHSRAESKTYCCTRLGRRALTLGGIALFGGTVKASAAQFEMDEFWNNIDVKSFPQYPGYITLNSGLQVREDRVGLSATPVAAYGDIINVRWRAWTVHQGRSLGTWQKCTFILSPPADDLSPSGILNEMQDSDSLEQVIPAWHEGLRGLRAGGVRRLLVPPLPKLSYPYVPLDSDSDRKLTKMGMTPIYPLSVGRQSLLQGVGPVPADPKGFAFLESVIVGNAFTIKLADRSVLWEVERLTDSGARAPWFISRGSEDSIEGIYQLRSRNSSGADGGASWWTLTLPPQGEGD